MACGAVKSSWCWPEECGLAIDARYPPASQYCGASRAKSRLKVYATEVESSAVAARRCGVMYGLNGVGWEANYGHALGAARDEARCRSRVLADWLWAASGQTSRLLKTVRYFARRHEAAACEEGTHCTYGGPVWGRRLPEEKGSRVLAAGLLGCRQR
jgi:hypothetical protein